MITIKDGIHGHIEVEGVAGDLLDTRKVQRLRRLQQLGNTSLVYPSANHTRFEHSLGVYYLADKAVNKLEIDEYHAVCLRAAAILHDIGHGPFSHNTEPLLRQYLNKDHDDVHDLLQEGEINRILNNHAIDPEYIADLIAGEGKYGQLISGELDVDRMDYLARDAHHTGVPYGTIDHEHLIHALIFRGSTLAIQEGNLQVAENLLTARTLMNPAVYHHHTARISEIMLLRATEVLLEEGIIAPESLRQMDDNDLVVTLRKNEGTEEMIKRINNRELYKRAVWVDIGSVPESLITASRDQIRSYEDAIAQKANLDSKDVILDIPDRPSIPESKTRIIKDGDLKPLREASSIIGALEMSNRNQWRLGVYTPDRHTDPVQEAANDVLGLDSTQTLFKERTDKYSNAQLDDSNK